MYLLNEFVSVVELATVGTPGLVAGTLSGRKASKEGKTRVQALKKGTASGALVNAAGLSILAGVTGLNAAKGRSVKSKLLNVATKSALGGIAGVVSGGIAGSIGSQLGYRNKLARKSRKDKGVSRGKYKR